MATEGWLMRQFSLSLSLSLSLAGMTRPGVVSQTLLSNFNVLKA